MSGSRKERIGGEGTIRRLVSAVALIMLTVVIVAGIITGARAITITYRAFLAMAVVKLVGSVVLRVLASYEEIIDSGEA